MFRWLEVLEKEFDKAFVDVDLLLGEIDPDQADITYEGRQKMTSLSSCFAQLCHKAQTVSQINHKLEVPEGRLRRPLGDGGGGAGALAAGVVRVWGPVPCPQWHREPLPCAAAAGSRAGSSWGGLTWPRVLGGCVQPRGIRAWPCPSSGFGYYSVGMERCVLRKSSL